MTATDLGHAWSTVRVSDPDGFARLAPEWDDLADRCATATPFQRSAWLSAWWRQYGGDGDLRVVGVRHNERLVAGAALLVERRAGARMLCPVGHGLSDITEFLVDDAEGGSAEGRLAGAVLDEPGWQVLELPEVRAGSAAERVAAHWSGVVSVASSTCLEVPFGSVEALLAGTEGRSRKRLRTRIRKVREPGVEYVVVQPADLDDGVARLVDLHRRQWEGRGGNPEHLDTRYHRMLVDALSTLVPAGHAQLDLYRVAGEDVAGMLLLVDRRVVYAYFLGVCPEQRDGGDGSALTLARSLDVVEQRGRESLDMLRGAESYKRRWQTVEIGHRRLLVARGVHPLARAYVAAQAARASLRRQLVERRPQLHAALSTAVQRARADGVGPVLRDELRPARLRELARLTRAEP